MKSRPPRKNSDRQNRADRSESPPIVSSSVARWLRNVNNFMQVENETIVDPGQNHPFQQFTQPNIGREYPLAFSNQAANPHQALITTTHRPQLSSMIGTPRYQHPAFLGQLIPPQAPVRRAPFPRQLPSQSHLSPFNMVAARPQQYGGPTLMPPRPQQHPSQSHLSPFNMVAARPQQHPSQTFMSPFSTAMQRPRQSANQSLQTPPPTAQETNADATIVHSLDRSWHLGTEHQQKAFKIINVDDEQLQKVIWNSLATAKKDFQSKQHKYSDAARRDKIKREQEAKRKKEQKRKKKRMQKSLQEEPDSSEQPNPRYRCGEPGCNNSKKQKSGRSEMSQHYRDHHCELQYNPDDFRETYYDNERCPPQPLWPRFFWPLDGVLPTYYPPPGKPPKVDKVERQIRAKYPGALLKAIEEHGSTLPPGAAIVSRAHPNFQDDGLLTNSNTSQSTGLRRSSRKRRREEDDDNASKGSKRKRLTNNPEVASTQDRTLGEPFQQGLISPVETWRGSRLYDPPMPSMVPGNSNLSESGSHDINVPHTNTQFVNPRDLQTPRATIRASDALDATWSRTFSPSWYGYEHDDDAEGNDDNDDDDYIRGDDDDDNDDGDGEYEPREEFEDIE